MYVRSRTHRSMVKQALPNWVVKCSSLYFLMIELPYVHGCCRDDFLWIRKCSISVEISILQNWIPIKIITGKFILEEQS